MLAAQIGGVADGRYLTFQTRAAKTVAARRSAAAAADVRAAIAVTRHAQRNPQNERRLAGDSNGQGVGKQRQGSASPTAPTNLTVSSATGTSVSLSWTASTDSVPIMRYDIYVGTTVVASTKKPQYTLSGLACGTTYTIAIAAVDQVGNVSPAATAVVATAACGDTQAPTAPTGMTLAGVSATTISVSWSAASDNVGVAGYDVYLDGSRVASGAATTYQASGLACGTTHSFGVDAYDAAGNRSPQATLIAATGPCSTGSSITADTTAPSTPGGLAVTTVTDTSMSLSWQQSTDNAGVTGYDVYLGGKLVATTANPSYSLSGLTCGTAYNIGVDAYDAAGNRSPQASVIASTSACAVPQPLWGMVGGYTSTQMSDLATRGIKLEMVEMSWAKAEPQEGVYDEIYFASVRNQIAQLNALGDQVVLNFGMHHAPSWLLAKPNAHFVNQYGDTYTATDEPNLVFNKSLRSYAEAYTAKVFSELGTGFFAVRVGGGHWGELQYPAQKDAAGKWEWWSFDANALTQDPVPIYRPCAGDTGQAGTFLNWYLDSLTDFQNWQIATVRRSFSGYIAVLYASWGMRSGDFDKAVADNLCGTSSAEINGEVQRGYDHARHIGAITDPSAAVWGTWAENSGTISFLAQLAAAKGLAVMGENAGGDTLAQMQTAVGAARQYGLTAFMWIRASDAYCFCNNWATINDYSTLTSSP